MKCTPMLAERVIGNAPPCGAKPPSASASTRRTTRRGRRTGSVFGNAVVGTAALDRLLHHGHVITIRGGSYRLRTKRRAGLVNQADATAETAAN